jgi:hypothetical protein
MEGEMRGKKNENAKMEKAETKNDRKRKRENENRKSTATDQMQRATTRVFCARGISSRRGISLFLATRRKKRFRV